MCHLVVCQEVPFPSDTQSMEKAQACSMPKSLAVATGQTKVIFLNISDDGNPYD